jgi:hypothetical protein
MTEPLLERRSGAGTLTLTGVGLLIGAGLFVIAGQAAAAYAGPASVLSFVLAGLVCVCSALCYTEMAAIAVGWPTCMPGVIGDLGLHLPVRWASLPLALPGHTLAVNGSVIILPAVLILFLVTCRTWLACANPVDSTA